MVAEQSSVTWRGRTLYSAIAPRGKQPHIQLEYAVLSLKRRFMKVTSHLHLEQRLAALNLLHGMMFKIQERLVLVLTS